MSPHFQLTLKATTGERWRIPINVKSTDGTFIWFLKEETFGPKATHFLESLLSLPEGFMSTADPACPKVDYVKRPLFDRFKMRQTIASGPGDNDDVQDVLFRYSEEARTHNSSTFVFGEPFEGGLHGLHMNQGSDGPHAGVNGSNQDGCLIFHFPHRPAGHQFVAFFFAFTEQCWFTNIRGYPLPGFADGPLTVVNTSAAGVPLVLSSVIVDPVGDDRGNEIVTIHNPNEHVVHLNGWMIQDGIGKVDKIGDIAIQPKHDANVHLRGNGASLPNAGGRVILLRPDGTTAHDATYVTRGERPGTSIKFEHH